MNNIVGKKIGNFEILEKYGDGANSYSKFLCRCHCGNERIYNGKNVTGGFRNSCGCERTKTVQEIGPDRVYNHYKQSSKTRKIEFTLTKEDFKSLVLLNCFYCNKPPSSKYKMNKCTTVPLRTFTYNGIDRVDNSIGYTKENSVTCCRRCNQMKNDMNLEEWLVHMKRILDNVDSNLMDIISEKVKI